MEDDKELLSLLKPLLCFQKNDQITFTSEIIKVNDLSVGNFKEEVELSKEYTADVYKINNVKADISNTHIESIGGIDFLSYTVKVYKDKKSLVLTQIHYRQIINECAFSVTIGYQKKTHLKEILESFKHSTFTKNKQPKKL